MIVRAFVPQDAPAVVRVLAASYEAAHRGSVADDALDTFIAGLDSGTVIGAVARRARDGGVTLVAEGAEDAGVVGYAGAGPQGDTAIVHALYVHPQAWRSGTGRALQREAMEQVRVGGANRAAVWVETANLASRAFYEQTGWALEGTTRVMQGFLGGLEVIRYERALPSVRPIDPSRDGRAVGEVHVQAWRDAYRGQMPDAYLDSLSIEDRAAFWGRANPGTATFVVALDGRLAGFVSVGPTRDGGVDAVTHEMYAINVPAWAWGSGVGLALLRTGEAALREMGASEATLWVLAGNVRARRFYEREAWEPDGTTKTDDSEGFTLREVLYRKTMSPVVAAPR